MLGFWLIVPVNIITCLVWVYIVLFTIIFEITRRFELQLKMAQKIMSPFKEILVTINDFCLSSSVYREYSRNHAMTYDLSFPVIDFKKRI